jgi:hypothetical protein
MIACALFLAGCADKPSKVEQYRAEKHVRDSAALVEQERSLAYYQAQMEILTAQADSLLPLFKYEKNEKYQDHGHYVATGKDGLRVMVRDDGVGEILMYRYGKRIESADDPMVARAQHLLIVMHDLRELEKRITHTSFEVQKYQKRLQNEANKE